MTPTRNDLKQKRSDPFPLLVSICIIGMTALLGKIIWSLPTDTHGLEDQVARHLDQSGATSPVTAVLLNFRGYDTLLEVMVLFLAIVGVWSLTEAPAQGRAPDTSPVQTSVVRILAPLMCLVGAYLVWQGSHLAGGAFQGGAVLAGAGVLMVVAEMPLIMDVPARILRLGLVLGPAVFWAVAVWCMIKGGALLSYPEQMADSLLLLIETGCALSIGLTLAALFVGGRPKHDLPALTKTPAPDKGGTEC